MLKVRALQLNVGGLQGEGGRGTRQDKKIKKNVRLTPVV